MIEDKAENTPRPKQQIFWEYREPRAHVPGLRRRGAKLFCLGPVALTHGFIHLYKFQDAHFLELPTLV